jgi:RND family efflux transporter MFP subunit
MDEAEARVKVARSDVYMAEARRRQVDERIRQGEEALASARVMAGFTEIRAPFAGRVVARLAEPGVIAAPGMGLVEIEQAGSYRLEAQVEESRLARVRRGQSVEVRLETMERPIAARVDEIVPAVDEASRTFTVKIALPSSAVIRTGLFGRAKFMGEGTRKVLAADSTALHQQGQLQQVFAAEGGVARLRMIRVGAASAGMTEVLSGLAAGEQVITPWPASLADGARVEVSR